MTRRATGGRGTTSTANLGLKDFESQEANEFTSLNGFNFVVFFTLRADVERRAGGNPSWNTGVDYEQQLRRSVRHAEVQALYKKAGLSLEADFKTLNDEPRIAADPTAVSYLSENTTFDGELPVPVLTVHTSGDDIADVQMEQAYAAEVQDAHHDIPSFVRHSFTALAIATSLLQRPLPPCRP